MASGSDSPATTISSDSPPEPQAEGTASSRLGPVENMSRPSVLKPTVKVLLPLPLASAYDYSVAQGREVAPGPLGSLPRGITKTRSFP